MPMKRIAIVSNYDRETFYETWLNVPPMEEQLANKVCEQLNKIHPEGENYYTPKDMSYQLYKFEP